jgi:phosphatidylglycerophosphate synthase
MFVVAYSIFSGLNAWFIAAIFAIAALTDFFDGFLARKLNMKTELGRKLDLIADRVLWVGTAIAILVFYTLAGKLALAHYLLLGAIMIREILATPFLIIALMQGKPIPHASKIAKATTFAQGFAIPVFIVMISYPAWGYASLLLSIVTMILGIFSAAHYLKDLGFVRR